MQAKLTINGVDFTPFIIEGGIVQTDVDRQLMQVVTLDGTLWRRSKRVRGIRVELRTLRDEYYKIAASAISADKVSVIYTDRDTGENTTGVFYVMERSAAVKRVSGGNTFWQSAGFYLEAM